MQNLYNIPDEVYLCYKSLKLYLIWYSSLGKYQIQSRFTQQRNLLSFNCSESDTFLMNYITNRESAYPNRINIPIADEDANVTFYTISREV